MPGRIVTHAVVVAIALLVTTLVPLRLTAAASTPVGLFSLPAALTVASDLPAISRQVLVAEAERIWTREGVSLDWPTTAAIDRAPLRVLVARRDALLKGRHERWPVAELIPQAEQRALAIASIAGAERVLEQADRDCVLLTRPASSEYRLGIVLGRAVAHEIGHYILATATHSDRGLMRPTIDAREFADPAANTFALDAQAGAWLRDHLRAADEEGSSASTPFSYAR